MVSQGAFGALLRQFRAAANITQEELAERSGLSLAAIAALEQRIRRSPRPSTVEWLAEALKLDARQKEAFVAAARGRSIYGAAHSGATSDAQSQLADAESLLASMPTDVLPARALLPSGSRMPLGPNPLFVGRGDELLEVAAALKGADATVALGQVVASTGLGGLGKTQLAVELVHRYGRFFEGGVFWLSFASAEEIPLQVAACAGPSAMDLAPGIDERPVEERAERVQRAWQNAVPRLLVFDNCEEEALLEAWRPTNGGCRVLVTSRRSQWSPTLGVTALSLDMLPRQDSIELLRRYRRGLAADDSGLDAIAEELGDLPLALHLAGSYLCAYCAEVSFDDYLTALRRSDVVQHASLLGAGLDDSVSPTHHVQGVAQTFALCLGRLDREREVDRVAIALLARMACMAPGEPVPRDLLAQTLEDVDPILRADGLRRLAGVGMVEEGEGWLRLHRLLAHFVRQARLDRQAPDDVDRILIGWVQACEEGRLARPKLAAIIHHVVHMTRSDTARLTDRAVICTEVGLALMLVSNYTAARHQLERAMETRQKETQSEHGGIVMTMNIMAQVLEMQGDLVAARAMLERALATAEFALGSNHSTTAITLHNLGRIHARQGDLITASSLLRRAVSVRELTLGPRHYRLARTLHTLAGVMSKQGETIEALSLAKRAAHICRHALGPEHIRTAEAYWALGTVLVDQSRLAAAKPLLEHALAVHERQLGRSSPETAMVLFSLALLRRSEGDFNSASQLLERTLAIRDQVFGPDHLATVATRRALEELAAEVGGAGAHG